jgi:hypothetical protein
MAFVLPVFAAIGTAAGASAATAGMAGLALTSAAVGAVGAIQSGKQASAAAKSEANMAEYNAKVAEYNASMSDIQARQTYAAAGVQEDEIRRRGRIAMGNQLAASAEAGAGLNGDLLRESVYGVEADSMAIRYDADLKAQNLKDSASLQRSAAAGQRSGAAVALDRGKQAKTASYLNAGSAILNASSSYYGAKSRITAAGKVE